MRTFFTADTHYSHRNLIERRYTKRPWTDVAEHDRELIDRHNSRVYRDDTVIHVGDFCWGGPAKAIELLRILRGQFRFMWGNHDDALRRARRVIETDPDLKKRVQFWDHYRRMKIGDQDIILCHYAFRVWEKSHYGSWNLYGHSHSELPDDPHARAIDVGVDCHDYAPIELEQVRELMAVKYWRPVDAHGDRLPDGGIGLTRDEYAKADRYRLYLQLQEEFKHGYLPPALEQHGDIVV